MYQTIVIDTETTGLPISYRMNATPNNLSNWDQCRIVQIAYRVYNPEDELVANINQIIKPNDFIIPSSSISFHKITNNRANHGVPIDVALKLLMTYVKNMPTRLVAHNIQFDRNVLISEMYRNGLPDLAKNFMKTQSVCTMLLNTPKGGRWPKLVNLYTSKFDDFDESKIHDAEYDTLMCSKVYFGK